MADVDPLVASTSPAHEDHGPHAGARQAVVNDLVSPDSEAAKARRRERINALRACRPHERMFLHQLPKSRYAPYSAGEVLGLSSRTVCKMLQRPRVKRAMAVFLDEALEKIGVTHASLVADLAEIKARCMQHRQVLDEKGNPVMVTLKDGTMAAAYAFDAKNAIAASKALMDLLNLTPAKRVEVTASIEQTTTTTHVITADMEADEAARIYQDIIRTH